jgi:tRNA A37 threonylcarbamoyladenosine modification protein TsaB
MAWLFIDTAAAGELRAGLLGPTSRLRRRKGRAGILVPFLMSIVGDQVPAGICVVAGPGSFSAVRSGVLAANLLARWWKVPLVGIDREKAQDLKALAKDLVSGALIPASYVTPVYDAEPNITIKAV